MLNMVYYSYSTKWPVHPAKNHPYIGISPVTLGPKVIKLFLCSTQLSMKLIAFVGILKFISRINTVELSIRNIYNLKA